MKEVGFKLQKKIEQLTTLRSGNKVVLRQGHNIIGVITVSRYDLVQVWSQHSGLGTILLKSIVDIDTDIDQEKYHRYR
jgi:hypothetical protein